MRSFPEAAHTLAGSVAELEGSGRNLDRLRAEDLRNGGRIREEELPTPWSHLERPRGAVIGAINGGYDAAREGGVSRPWEVPMGIAEGAIGGFYAPETAKGKDLALIRDIDNPWVRKPLGFAVELVGDPLNYVPGIGLTDEFFAVGGRLDDGLRMARRGWDEIGEAARGGLDDGYNVLRGGIDDFGGAVRGGFDEGYNSLRSSIDDFGEAVRGGLDDSYNSLRSGTDDFGGAVRGGLDDGYDVLRGGIDDFGGLIRGGFDDGYNSLRSSIDELGGGPILDRFDDSTRRARGGFDKLDNRLGGAARNGMDSGSRLVGDRIDDFSEAVGGRVGEGHQLLRSKIDDYDEAVRGGVNDGRKLLRSSVDDFGDTARYGLDDGHRLLRGGVDEIDGIVRGGLDDWNSTRNLVVDQMQRRFPGLSREAARELSERIAGLPNDVWDWDWTRRGLSKLTDDFIWDSVDRALEPRRRDRD